MNNFALGAIAEQIAFEEELVTVPTAYKKNVRLVSDQTKLGYDIESLVEIDGVRKFKAIEVKTWNRDGFFYISSHEISVLKSLGGSAWIYLVDVGKKRIVKKINNPFFDDNIEVVPLNFKAFY